MRLSPCGCQDTRGKDHDGNFTSFALDGTAKAEGVQVMLHLIQRESNTDAEGGTQVNNRREGGQEEDEVCRGGHNFLLGKQGDGCICAQFVNVITRTATSLRQCSNRKKYLRASLTEKVCNNRTWVIFRRTWESAGVRVWFRFLSFFRAVCVEVDSCATLFAWYCDLLAVEAPNIVKAQSFVPN